MAKTKNIKVPMKIKTRVKAGAITVNHNEALRAAK